MRRDSIRENLIYSKMVEIEESVDMVRKNLPRDFDSFSVLGIIKDGIYKRVEYAIENVFDICHILNSDLSLGIPSGEDDVIQNLKSSKIIDSSITQKLTTMRRFRNIVVHRYGKIDDALTFSIMSEHLDDFFEFTERIRKFLKEPKGQ